MQCKMQWNAMQYNAIKYITFLTLPWWGFSVTICKKKISLQIFFEMLKMPLKYV